jgi:hypothetical protein
MFSRAKKVHDPSSVLGHIRGFQFLAASYQPQDTSSEIFGGALGGNIREADEQG